ncbi:MAG TPA: diaminopimelate epimerase [Planctomycetota bacterium]|nr:diaminopimelate epimerase [Planctomycetota bacterium]
MRFTKMHGCGNDYVFVDAWDEVLPADVPGLARAISDRHTGVGADGLIVLAPSRKADARMIMFNADGSESEMCGNGIRCVAKLAWDRKRVATQTPRIETGAGVLPIRLQVVDGRCVGATVEMGAPRLTPATVPVDHLGPGPALEVLITAGGRALRFLAVGMGNPHAVCFVDDAGAFPLAEIGPLIERHVRFPRRTNVEIVQRLADEGGLPVLRQRTWERGSGVTQACGTGACAVTAAAIIDRRIDGREAIVRLDGGDLRIGWARDDATVVMTGPAVEVFSGDWPTR